MKILEELEQGGTGELEPSAETLPSPRRQSRAKEGE
jgi:hypothetical protein